MKQRRKQMAGTEFSSLMVKPAFLDYACKNKIIVLGYPPHCTYALRGLDVVCFGKMKECWRKEIDQFEQTHKRDVMKGDFTHLFGRAYIKAFDQDTIKAAFHVTGVHPFSHEAITEDQMKPSIPHSVKGSFPLPQPSPVRAVIAAFHHQPPTSFNVSPSTHSAVGVAHTSPCPSESHCR
jgi:hypothetical protein